MRKFLTAVLSVMVMFCGCFLTACGTTDVNLTYVALVNNSTGFTASDADTAIAIGIVKGSTLKTQIDEYLNTLSQSDKSELMTKMVALKNSDDASFTPNYDVNHSTANGVFKVGMECAYEPYNWTQNDDSNGAIKIEGVAGKYANGYDVQIAAQVAAALNMKLEIYQYEFSSLIPAVQSGTLDAIIAGMSPTEERLQEIDFSVAYYQSNLVIITREGSKIASCTTLAELDKQGIKIAAQPGTFHLDALKEQTNNLTVVDNLSDFVDMKMALMAGTIDGYVAEEPTAMTFCMN